MMKESYNQKLEREKEEGNQKETTEYFGRKSRPLVSGSEYEDIVNRQLEEDDYNPKESEQRHMSRQGKEFVTPEEISSENNYDSRFVSESDATDEEILDEILDAGLSTDDLSIEALRGMKADEREGFYKEFGKIDDSSWEKNFQKTTDALLEKLPYDERKDVKEKIDEVRKAHYIEPGIYKHYSSKQRYLHNRTKNKELNEVLRKYFSVKEGERLDFGKEESWKYEPIIDVKRREKNKEIDEAKKEIEKKANKKFWTPWKKWKKMDFAEKHQHTEEKEKEIKSKKLNAEVAGMDHYKISYEGSPKEGKNEDLKKQGWKIRKRSNSKNPTVKKIN